MGHNHVALYIFVRPGSVLPLYSFPCSETLRDKRVRQFGAYNLPQAVSYEMKHGSSYESLEDFDVENYHPRKIAKLPGENSILKSSTKQDYAEEEASSESSVVDNTVEPTNPGSPESKEENRAPSAFDDAVMEAWEKADQVGLMKYDVTECRTKVADGKYSFVLQLNLGRAIKKRQTEYRIDKVEQSVEN